MSGEPVALGVRSRRRSGSPTTDRPSPLPIRSASSNDSSGLARRTAPVSGCRLPMDRRGARRDAAAEGERARSHDVCRDSSFRILSSIVHLTDDTIGCAVRAVPPFLIACVSTCLLRLVCGRPVQKTDVADGIRTGTGASVRFERARRRACQPVFGSRMGCRVMRRWRWRSGTTRPFRSASANLASRARIWSTPG